MVILYDFIVSADRLSGLAVEFASRGLVVLGPGDLGIPADVHRRVYEKQKAARDALAGGAFAVGSAEVPEILEVLRAPGFVAACDRLAGPNWAIVPHYPPGLIAGGGASDQHWHKDDNGPFNARKQRHHQAVQLEVLYFPQAVAEDMGPTATIPYAQYWTVNHEEDHDNFSGAESLDFPYILGSPHARTTVEEREPVSGPDSKYDVDDIVNRRTAHDERLREAVRATGWPLAEQYEAGPLEAGSVLVYSQNLFHRGNHRRDDWRTWKDNPRFAWRFYLYRTTDPDPDAQVAPVDWAGLGVDPLTGIDRSQAGEDVTELWRYHRHWILTGSPPPPRAVSASQRDAEAERLFAQLYAKGEQGEPLRVGAAYRLASIGDAELAVELLGRALRDERENVRRAAVTGLIAVGPAATSALLDAARSPVKWVRKAGVYGLGDAAPLTREVLDVVSQRLLDDPSVYVRSVAAGTLGCLGRRAIATGTGVELVPDCVRALVASLEREENRPCMSRAQGRSIKFVRPTDDSDMCEGFGVDFGLDRFEPVRSAVRENALWSLVILCSHGTAVLGDALEPAIDGLRAVVRHDSNVSSVGYAQDALTRLAHLRPNGEPIPPAATALRDELLAILAEAPIQCGEALVRDGLPGEALAQLTGSSNAFAAKA